MICFRSDPPGFICWTSVAPAFQSLFADEYSSYFISVMNLDLYGLIRHRLFQPFFQGASHVY